MTILLSKGIYTGSPESTQQPFATGREQDQLATLRHDLPDSPRPEISPEDFARTINARQRGRDQASDGWRMDHIKDLNSPPTTTNAAGDIDDPLGPFREFCVTYAAGNLPIEESYYLS
jgi:hypothetical protein